MAVPEGGKPTSEGLNRDGVDFVLMVLLKRTNVNGGKTIITDENKKILN